jgi:hypothetical protein
MICHARLDSWQALSSKQLVDGHDVGLRHGIAGLSGSMALDNKEPVPIHKRLNPARRIVFGVKRMAPATGGLVELGPFFEGTVQAFHGPPFNVKSSTLSSLELFNIDHHQKY